MKTKTAVWVVLAVAVSLAALYFIHSSRQTRPRPEKSVAIGKAPESKPPREAVQPPAHVPPARVSSNLQPVLVSGAPYLQRLAALRALPANLTADDFKALSAFLLQRTGEDDTQMGQALKNELMNRLCALDPQPDELIDLFIGIYHDRNQSDVLRDYAVQHLAALCQQMAATPPGAAQNADPKLAEAEEALWEAVAETQNSIAGTALLGLTRLVQGGVAIDEERIGRAALKLAYDDSAGELARISAYQVCGRLNVQSALPVIETAAQGSSTVALQISAIGALGLIGGQNDLPLLQQLLQSSEARLKAPAQTAMNRIEQRLQNPVR